MNAFEIKFTCGVGFDRDGVPILPGEIADSTVAIENLLLNLFGGFTRQLSRGGWQDGDSTVRESGTVFSVIAAMKCESREKAATAQRFICDQYRQKSVMLTVTPCEVFF